MATVPQIARKKLALSMLEAQLLRGNKNARNGSGEHIVLELTKGDVKRIKSDITILKSRVK